MTLNIRPKAARWCIPLSLATLALLAGGCQSITSTRPSDAPAATSRGADAPLLDGMGDHSRRVTTTSPLAQRYFNQGLVLAYAFNHDEAIRSFRRAAELDPSCAMAWWGVALCNGPHINNPVVPEDHARDAWDAAQHAQALKGNCTPVERALIEAVATRYAADPKAERRPLDEAYASAMREVARQFPRDDDVATLFAESLMDLRPWDLWLKPPPGSTVGTPPTPQPGTQEIVATLERALALNPNNPGANHLYIHTMEASPAPTKAVAAADRLRALVPGAGHLVHMPSHIDIRVGNWAAAALANERAVDADDRYRRISPRQEFYRVYMAHNHHFLAFTAMMEGRREAALDAARDMVGGVPDDYIESSAPLVDPYMSIVYDVHKRFGRWDELLLEPAPHPKLVITAAMWRFNRAVALAAKGDTARARSEQERFREAVRAVPADAIMAINPAHKVLSIAAHMLEGEIALAERRTDDAVRSLREAVAVEDSLLYMEPPDWIQPVRHALGAVLIDAARYAEAERVYRDDLVFWPENAWSLKGLRDALRAQGRAAAANALSPRVERAWARADTRPSTTCLCVR